MKSKWISVLMRYVSLIAFFYKLRPKEQIFLQSSVSISSSELSAYTPNYWLFSVNVYLKTKSIKKNMLRNICNKITYFLADYEKLGLLLLGSSPGGAPSNFWTAMFDGDINLSVTMTLLSSVASFAMTSLWVTMLNEKKIWKKYYLFEVQIFKDNLLAH